MKVARDADVLVVGAGPIGLATALGLAEAGCSVEIIDEEDRGTVHGYALALHPGSLEALDRFGVVPDLIARGNRVRRLAFYDGAERRAEIALDRLRTNHPFALALPQSTFEDTLVQLLRARRVKVRWNHRLAGLTASDTGVTARVDALDRVSAGYPVATMSQVVVGSTEVTPRVVVGADGHRSLVRRSLGAEFRRLGEPRMFLVFEFSTDRVSPDDEMRVVIKDGLSAGLWPLPGGRYRWSFEIADLGELGARVDDRRLVRRIGQAAYPHVAEERLTELIAYRAPWFDAAVVGDILWSLAVRFERRLTSSMGGGPVWLAGDAAHLTMPIGMHSMNLGIAEAAMLAAAISSNPRSSA